MSGEWIARRVGLLSEDPPQGERLGVGLSVGLLVFAATWAAVLSGGRSSFTPVAIAFGVAIAVGGRRAPGNLGSRPDTSELDPSVGRRRSTLAPAPALVAACFVVAVAVMYGATMAPSPRDDLQPVAFMDEAYYSVLGRDLARTGTETIYSPSGFDELPGLPTQTWYHWGELWLAASTITLFGMDPMVARHYVVLPLLLLAAAALTGTLVRRATNSRTTGAFVFGAMACLFLAPVPLPGTWFAGWARGLVFGITMYGLASIAALLSLFVVIGRRRWPPGMPLFSGAVIASMVPSHIIIAALALVGVAGLCIVYAAKSLLTERRLPHFSRPVQQTLIASAVVMMGTIAWGAATQHGLGTSGMAESVAPFNDSWRKSVGLTTLGAGVILLLPLAWWKRRPIADSASWIFPATLILLLVGAILWGARLGDFTMFHVFYGGLAVFATPAAAIAVWALWRRWRNRRFPIAGAILFLASLQLALGSAATISRLQQFGPGAYEPIPVSLLDEIRRLPTDAKVAYACRELEEIGFFWDSRLLSIDADTGRRIIPMCFQAEFFGILNGIAQTKEVVSPQFELAPQRSIFPNSEARPSSAAMVEFMERHGINYIYADAAHPNSLVSDAVLVAAFGDFQLLRLP